MLDEYDGEQDEPEDDEVHETDLAAFLGTSGEDPRGGRRVGRSPAAGVARGSAAWLQRQEQRFKGKAKGKGKNQGKGKAKGKGKNKGSNLSLEERKKRLAELQEPYQLPSVRCARTLGRRRHLSQEPPRATVRRSHRRAGIWLLEAKHPVLISPSSTAIRLQMPQPWSRTHASMPATYLWRHRRRHRQVRDDRGNHRVSFPHRLHRHRV